MFSISARLVLSNSGLTRPPQQGHGEVLTSCQISFGANLFHDRNLFDKLWEILIYPLTLVHGVSGRVNLEQNAVDVFLEDVTGISSGQVEIARNLTLLRIMNIRRLSGSQSFHRSLRLRVSKGWIIRPLDHFSATDNLAFSNGPPALF